MSGGLELPTLDRGKGRLIQRFMARGGLELHLLHGSLRIDGDAETDLAFLVEATSLFRVGWRRV